VITITDVHSLSPSDLTLCSLTINVISNLTVTNHWLSFFFCFIHFFSEGLCPMTSIQRVCVIFLIKPWSTFFYDQAYSFTGTRGTDHPPFSNFLFTNLFSIKFLYFFIISSLFPYFNLFVSIFIQSYVNTKLHVSTL
jgi:hypothetical protein